MSKRNLIIAALALAILAAIIHFTVTPGNKKTDDKINLPIVQKELIELFTEIVIETNESTVHLKKQNDLWTISESDEFPASIKKLIELVDKLTSYKISSVITKDPKRLAHFKLKYKSESGAEESNGTQLTLKNKDQNLLKVLIGKKRQSKSSSPETQPQPGGTYIRIGDKKTVYIIKEDLELSADPEEWMKKTLFGLDKEQIKSIRYKKQKTEFILERESLDKELKIADMKKDEKMADYELSSLLSDLKAFKINKIIPASRYPEKELETKSTITITLFDTSTIDFQLLAKEKVDPATKTDKKAEKEYTYFITILPPSSPAAGSNWQSLIDLGKDRLFQLDEWQAKRWLKTKKDFVTAATEK